MNILVTGGTGYIGSHICVELLESGYDVVVIDDFSNSKPDVLDSIYKITGKHVKFYEFNVLNEEKTESVFKENKLDGSFIVRLLKRLVKVFKSQLSIIQTT